jgi:phospholipase C
MKSIKYVTVLCVLGLMSLPGMAQTLPHYDHIVIVMDENKSYTQIMGTPADAPYINSLATQGANMTGMYAETHPSQPNYLALFSGSMQGVTDDSTPSSLFTTPNLFHDLGAKGLSFCSYQETLPSVGFNGDSYTLNSSLNEYVRKHNPVANWASATPGTNQVPLSENQPYTSFPSSGNYASLPTVSFVVPNEQNDMHDGTIIQGDQWMQANMDSYAQWAKTHNSLLIFTMDENDGSPGNGIPTILVGQGIVPGNYSESVNHYNLLRTIEDMYGLPYDGLAAESSDITDVFATPEPATMTLLAIGGLLTLRRRNAAGR